MLSLTLALRLVDLPFYSFTPEFITGCHAAPADQSNEEQSNAADTLEEEQKEQEGHDGSLWWHGMFVKAGRMGNMAADVQAGSKPEVRAFFTGAPLAWC